MSLMLILLLLWYPVASSSLTVLGIELGVLGGWFVPNTQSQNKPPSLPFCYSCDWTEGAGVGGRHESLPLRPAALMRLHAQKCTASSRSREGVLCCCFPSAWLSPRGPCSCGGGGIDSVGKGCFALSLFIIWYARAKYFNRSYSLVFEGIWREASR